MARPRKATDEEMIAAAEALAEEFGGWRKVFGSTVSGRLGVGGSLSTYTRVVNAWREKKAESTATSGENSASEVVIDRVSIIDEGLIEVGDTLKKLRESVTQEIERAVADERRKGDAIRADERSAYEKAVKGYKEEVASLQAENTMLATEAEEEEDRADTAENAFEAMTAEVDALRIEAAKVPTLVDEASSAKTAAEEAEKRADAAISKAGEDIAKAEKRESDAVKRADNAGIAASAEKERADKAWSQVEALRQQLDDVMKRIDA